MPVIYRDLTEYQLLYQSDYLRASENFQFVDLVRKMMSDSNFYSKGLNISQTLIGQFDKDSIYKQLIDLYQAVNKSSN